jgi:NADH-ubiquinone oxidoreductase chain 5
MCFLLLFSGPTVFMAGLGATFEYDLRKIISFSTLRQLGLIIGAVSVGLVIMAFFHFITHALFKALFFICAGVIILHDHRCENLKSYKFFSQLNNVIISCFSISGKNVKVKLSL